MGKVYAELGMSLDGFVAGPNARPGNPLGDGGTRIHQWMYPLGSFRERLGLAGGATNIDDAIIRASFARPGAYVMGRRTFDEGEVSWPENAPFRAPVFVVTHHAREPWARPGGTTFTFVTGGIESALDRARAVADGRDVRIAGGADVVQQAICAGMLDELVIRLAPVLLGDGVRLFERLGPARPRLECTCVLESPLVTHLTYRVARRGEATGGLARPAPACHPAGAAGPRIGAHIAANWRSTAL